MSNQYTTPNLLMRFWSKVEVSVNDNECWEWKPPCLSTGYGQFWHERRNKLAHRFAYELSFGGITDKLEVCHTCDNKKCCNPKHLFLGTQQDNMNDKVAKGRQNKRENHGNHKLTESDVAYIRARYQQGDIGHRPLAREVGISRTQLRRILSGESWRDS